MSERDEKPHKTPLIDLERFEKTALSRRELAWKALKTTRNPLYVAMRYGYPVAVMQAALDKLPPPQVGRGRVDDPTPASTGTDEPRRASEVLPDSLRAGKPREESPG